MAGKLLGLIKLMRVEQWYKNAMMFVPLVFSMHLLDAGVGLAAIKGFAALCLVSSASYAINDIIDVEKDRAHPEKRKRPVASGTIGIPLALVLAVVFIAASVFLGLKVSRMFTFFVGVLFVSTMVYSFFLKNLIYADVITIATNFVIRTVSGAYVMQTGLVPFVEISPWLILCPFFLAMFLVSGKRYGDLVVMERPELHKKVLKDYTKESALALVDASMTLLLMVYSLYTYYNERKAMMITIPLAMFIILRYRFLMVKEPRIARHPHEAYKDRQLFVGVLMFCVLVAVILFFDQSIAAFFQLSLR